MEFLFNWVDIHVLEIDCQSFPSLYAILSYRRPQRTVSQATINNWNWDSSKPIEYPPNSVCSASVWKPIIVFFYRKIVWLLSVHVITCYYFRKQMIAIVPLVSYLSGFLTSTVVPFITKRTNNHFLYIIGVSFVLSSSGWAYSIANPISSVGINSSQKYHVIGIAMFSGIGKGFRPYIRL